MGLADYLSDLRDELPRPELVDAIVEHMENNDWVTIWQTTHDDEFWISVREDSSDEESDDEE